MVYCSSMANVPLLFTDTLYKYYQSVAFQEPEILTELRAEMASHPQTHMQAAPEVGRLLALLVRLLRPKTILEIGTFCGYSSVSMALEMPPESHLFTCDRDPTIVKIAQKYWAKAKRDSQITLKMGNALETIAQLTEENFVCDFMFIDADKRFYDQYYEYGLLCVRSGGLLVFDNVLWKGAVAQAHPSDLTTQALQHLNQKISQDPRIFSFMLPLSDGVTVVQKL